VSLGDTDEWAHAGDYELYMRALNDADDFIGKLIKEYDDNTIFILAEDHGRSSDWRSHGWDKDSARVWMMFYGKNVPANHFVKYNNVKSLSNIRPTILHLTNKEHSKDSLL
jgi:2,3-bisphosphoglycerate-independent phosphoglycerate mutase